MNPYAYVDGNPETYNDPTGQAFQDPGRGGSGGTGGSGGGMSNPGSGGSTGGNSSSGWGNVFAGTFGEVVKTVERVTEKVAAVTGEVVATTDTEVLPTIGAIVVEAGVDVIDVVAAGVAALDPVTAAIVMLLASPKATANGDLPASFYHTWEPSDGPPVTKPSPVGGGVGNNQGGPPATSGATGEPCSFTPNTLVATANGEQPIGKLHVGEQVWAYNPKTHKMELQPIEHVWIHKDSDLVNLTITYQTSAQHGKADSKGQTETSEAIHTTSEHPFYTTEHGFVPAGKLKVGMHILRADGAVGVVTQTQLVHRTEMMYNLEVAHDHTFVVGSGQWVVHNRCDAGNLRRSLNNAGRTVQNGQNPHHIIPCSLRNHALVQEATRGGFDINAEYNGRPLWDYLHKANALADMEPYHANAPTYANLARGLLDDEYQGLLGSGMLTPNNAYNSVMYVINVLNSAIDVQGYIGVLAGGACALPGI